MAVGTLYAVSLDCADQRQLADFWLKMLDGTVVYDDGKYILVISPSVSIGALHIDDYVPPTWPLGEVPKQMHLEIGVPDLDTAEHAAVALGARKTELQPAPDRWRVLLDPAGHPFCLYKPEPHLLYDH